MTDTIRLYGLVTDSIVDGPGFRTSIFTQGCPHHCPGCHNPGSHDFDAGTVYSLVRRGSEVFQKSPAGRRDPHRGRAVLPGGGVRGAGARARTRGA